jgi:hypothetical protein
MPVSFLLLFLVTLGWIPSQFNSPNAEPLLKLRLRDAELWLCSIPWALGALADPSENNQHISMHFFRKKYWKDI